MAARGIKVNHDGDGANSSFAGYASTNFFNPATTDLVICLWARVKGNAASAPGGEGNTLFITTSDVANWTNEDITLFYSDAAGGSPYTGAGRIHGSAYSYSGLMNNQATDEDWFIALAYDGTGHNGVWYYGKDQDGAITSATTGAGQTWGAAFDAIYFGGAPDPGGNIGSNVEITNVKMWMGGSVYSTFTASSGAALLAEMQSESVVSSTNLFDHWTLDDNTDLTGSQGHVLTLTGTVTSGTMDPVDIQGGGAAPRRIFVVS